MSDYRFMLENHLSTAQARVLAEVQKAAAEARVNLFLTGGALRDMLGGFQVRDLDFSVEGDALKLARTVSQEFGAEILSTDTHRRTAHLQSPDGVAFELGMARQERYTKPGGKPQVTPATVHEDLQRRDFTINAIGLSLNRASRGLLMDPANGVGDLQHRELRSTGSQIFNDRPIRLLRLIRFRVRFGFTVTEKTLRQFQNACEAGVPESITRAELAQELRQAAFEPDIAELLKAWDHEGFLALVSPVLTGAALNLQSFTRLQRFRQSLPFEPGLRVDEPALFFALLTESLPPKERSALAELDAEHSAAWSKLGSRTAKLEKEIAAQRMNRPSQVYQAFSKIPGEQLLLLVLRSTHKVVQERVRNYLQKYLPAAQEITDLQVVEAGHTVGTPKFAKAKAEMIAKVLDAKPKKVEPTEEIA